MKPSEAAGNSTGQNQFASCVSILSLYGDDASADRSEDHANPSSAKRKARRIKKFIYNYLEDKMLEIGRHVRVQRGKTVLKGLLRFVPGAKKSSKAKGYDHLITDEERR